MGGEKPFERQNIKATVVDDEDLIFHVRGLLVTLFLLYVLWVIFEGDQLITLGMHTVVEIATLGGV